MLKTMAKTKLLMNFTLAPYTLNTPGIIVLNKREERVEIISHYLNKAEVKMDE